MGLHVGSIAMCVEMVLCAQVRTYVYYYWQICIRGIPAQPNRAGEPRRVCRRSGGCLEGAKYDKITVAMIIKRGGILEWSWASMVHALLCRWVSRIFILITAPLLLISDAILECTTTPIFGTSICSLLMKHCTDYFQMQHHPCSTFEFTVFRLVHYSNRALTM